MQQYRTWSKEVISFLNDLIATMHPDEDWVKDAQKLINTEPVSAPSVEKRGVEQVLINGIEKMISLLEGNASPEGHHATTIGRESIEKVKKSKAAGSSQLSVPQEEDEDEALIKRLKQTAKSLKNYGKALEALKDAFYPELPVSAPSVPTPKDLEKEATEAGKEYVMKHSPIVGHVGVATCVFSDGYIAGYEAKASALSSVQPQSEGGLQWVKEALDKLTELAMREERDWQLCHEHGTPYDKNPAIPKLKEEIVAAFFPQHQCEGGLQWVSLLRRAFVYIEMLQEDNIHDPSVGLRRDQELEDLYAELKKNMDASPSTANTEEERLNKEITGFDTVAERVAYDEGYSANQKVMMQWIEKWDGSTNSTLGELLDRKFKELNTEEGADKWTPEEIQGLENQIELLEGRVYELSNQLEASKEQQIYFAEWAGAEGFHYADGCWYEGVGFSREVGGTEKLHQRYELFLTETKQQ